MARVPQYEQQVGVQGGVTPNRRYQDFSGYAQPADFSKPLGAMAKIALQEAEQIDDARVTDKLTQLRKFALDRRIGPTGFMNLKGQNALLPDEEGNGLAARESRAMSDYAESLTEDLTPAQRVLFKKRSAPVFTQQDGFATQHVFEQNNQYQTDTFNARVSLNNDMARSNFDNPDVVTELIADQEDAIRGQAARLGYSPEQTVVALREGRAALVEAGVLGALDASIKDPSKAAVSQSILDSSRDIPAAKRDELQGKINARNDVINITAFGDQVAWEARAEPSPFNLAFGAAAGLSGAQLKAVSQKVFHQGLIPVESNGRHFERDSEGRAKMLVGRNSDGTLPPEGERAFGIAQMQEKIARHTAEKLLGQPFDLARWERDPDYALALGATWFDYLANKYQDVTKAVAAYHQGETNLDAAIAKAKAAGDESKWLEHIGPEGQKYVAKVKAKMDKVMSGAVFDKDGKSINPFDPRYAQASKVWKTRADFERMAKQFDPRAETNPEWRQKLVDEAMARQSQEQSDYATNQTNRLSQARDCVERGVPVPQELLDGMNVVTQQALREYQKKVEANDTSGDQRLADEFLTKKDGRLLALSEDEMLNLTTLFPKADRETARKLWYQNKVAEANADNAAGQRDMAAQQGIFDKKYVPEASDIKSSLERAGLKLDKEKTETSGPIIRGLMTDLASIAQSRGVPLNAIDMDKEVQRLMSTKYEVAGFVFGPDHKSIFEMTVDDLPNSGRADAYRMIKSIAEMRLPPNQVGRREPSEGEMNQVLYDIFMHRDPDIDLRQVVWDKNAAIYMSRKYSEAHGGEQISSLDLLRGIILLRLSGERIPAEPLRISASERYLESYDFSQTGEQ